VATLNIIKSKNKAFAQIEEKIAAPSLYV